MTKIKQKLLKKDFIEYLKEKFILGDIEKYDKELIEELMQTALIVRDFESRYNLSLELLKLNTVEPMPEETIMKIRQKYKLNSAVWIKAELTIQEGTGNEEPEQ